MVQELCYIYPVEKFTIQTDDGTIYPVYARFEHGETVFSVRVEQYMVMFKGKPDWDTIGEYIIPVNPPADLDAKLLEEIATKIDNFNL